jgi:PAS domain S-box-containing protein
MKPLAQTLLCICWVGAAFAMQGEVPQAIVNPRPIHLPIVDGTDIRFARLSSAGGRYLSKVAQIVQDNQGFLWFGTQDGLNRFDGYSLKLFMPDPNNENSISGVFISALFKDREGALWIGCPQFVNRFESRTETFSKYPIPFVHHISQDSSRILWFATPTGLYRLDPADGQIKHYLHQEHDPSSLSSSNVEFSGEDKQGRFWVASSEGLDQFDRTNGKVILHVPLPEPPEGFSFYEDRWGVFWLYNLAPDSLAVFDRRTNRLTHFSFDRNNPGGKQVTGISAMLEDPEGNLWLATHGAGLLKFDRDHQKFVRYRNNPSDLESLPQNNVESLFLDREGSIWAGLGRLGIARFNRNSLPFQRFLHLDSPDNPVQPFVGAIYEDRKGILWIGTPAALNGIDRRGGHYTYVRRTPDPVATTDVISIAEDSLSNLWVGTYSHGLLCLNRRTGRFRTYKHNPADPNSISSDIVHRMLLDHSGTLWLATANGLDRFDAQSHGFITYLPDPAPNPNFLDVVEDRDHVLWLGTISAGLYRFDPATEKFTKDEHDTTRPGTLSDNRVNSVHFDHAGRMWVGTQNGLNEFDRKTGTFKVYSQRDGTPGHSVGCILEDEVGDLWMGTNNGVARFNPGTRTFQSYSTPDGLPGPDLTGWAAGFRSPSGEMFLGGFSGATAFFPGKVKEASYTPPVVLTDFQLSGNHVAFGNHSWLPQSISYTGNLVLTHEQSIFSLTFAALSYSNPATNRYRYKLEGLQTDWSEVGAEARQVTYTTLPSGNYTFRVQGATSRGPWSQPGVALNIRILPAWWATWWFRTICICTLGTTLWTLYLLRVQQLRREERKLGEAIEIIPAMAWIAGPDGAVQFRNRRWVEYTGLSQLGKAEEVGTIAIHPEDLDRIVRRMGASFASGEPFEEEMRIRRTDGEYRWFLSRAVPLRDKRGKVVKWYGAATDIQDRKRAEELQANLAHTNRLSVLGELVASISHELAQPIMASTNNAKASLRWLQRDPPDLTRVRKGTESIIEAGIFASEIINRLRSLYKKAPPKRELVAINEVIDEMVVLLRGEANGYAVSIRTGLAADLPKCTADRVQLQQVLMNLMLNGIEAMKETGGVLTVKTGRGECGQVLISVSDTGVGLPAGRADEIFNAFFTTKPQGSGMGLAISRSIVESHGGRLWATSHDGGGATFHFTLPTAVAEVSAAI